MFAYHAARDRVEVAFTDRHGGISGGPYASLNLASHSDDDVAAVRENLRRAVRAFTGEPAGEDGAVAMMSQVHGSDVYVVRGGPPATPPTADALVTSSAGVVLMVRVADCVPVLLADGAAGVVAAVHAGRPGLVAEVVPATVAAMRAEGAQDLVAWLGPHVCGACYEVPEELRAEVSAVVPESYAETSWGTPSLDIGAGVVAQLGAAGVVVVDAGGCTREDDNLFSYRRQGAASGRSAGLVWVRP